MGGLRRMCGVRWARLDVGVLTALLFPPPAAARSPLLHAADLHSLSLAPMAPPASPACRRCRPPCPPPPIRLPARPPQPSDKSAVHIRCDERLRAVFGADRMELGRMGEALKEHLTPPEPITLLYAIRCGGDGGAGGGGGGGGGGGSIAMLCRGLAVLPRG